MKSFTLTLHQTMAVYESKLPMAVAHDGFTLAFFLAGRGGGGGRGEVRSGEARMGPDPQGCWTGPFTVSSTGVLDRQLTGDLHGEELDRSVDEQLTEALHGEELGGPWMSSSSRMTSIEEEERPRWRRTG
jgi:hypothetical protein